MIVVPQRSIWIVPHVPGAGDGQQAVAVQRPEQVIAALAGGDDIPFRKRGCDLCRIVDHDLVKRVAGGVGPYELVDDLRAGSIGCEFGEYDN